MVFDIPEPYCWDESFKVFYENLDEQHRGLFDGIFKCAAQPSCADSLSKLQALVKHHFDTEEDMMGKANYSDLEEHKELHDQFLEKLGSLAAPLSDEVVKYAKEWLVNHIKGVDFKYKEKLG